MKPVIAIAIGSQLIRNQFYCINHSLPSGLSTLCPCHCYSETVETTKSLLNFNVKVSLEHQILEGIDKAIISASTRKLMLSKLAMFLKQTCLALADHSRFYFKGLYFSYPRLPRLLFLSYFTRSLFRAALMSFGSASTKTSNTTTGGFDSRP